MSVNSRTCPSLRLPASLHLSGLIGQSLPVPIISLNGVIEAAEKTFIEKKPANRRVNMHRENLAFSVPVIVVTSTSHRFSVSAFFKSSLICLIVKQEAKEMPVKTASWTRKFDIQARVGVEPT